MKITKAEIIPPSGWGDHAKVIATFSDGSEAEVVRYFTDELSFTAEEFVGLTKDEAVELYYQRDKAYLQS